jgi:hypothetical protein
MDESQNANSNSDSNNNSIVDDLKSGPFSLLYDAVKNNVQILINVRNNHKYIARVKAYDRHMNLYVCYSIPSIAVLKYNGYNVKVFCRFVEFTLRSTQTGTSTW